MYKKIKYSLIIFVICLFIPLYNSAGAEPDGSKKKIDLVIGKKTDGLMQSGTTETYIIKPTQVGKLTITITNYINDYTTAYFYSDDYSDKEFYTGANYEEASGCSTIKFDVYVNKKTYYLYLKNEFIINSGDFTISTRFTPVNAVNADQLNDTMDDSIPIYNNKYYIGILSSDEAENYYSIRFKKKTKFKLEITCKNQSAIDITIMDADGNTIYNDWCYYNTKTFLFDDYLSAGKYDIIIKKSGADYYNGRRYQMVTGEYIPITSISIPSKKDMKTGQTYTFKPTLKPSDATGDYFFTSSNEKVIQLSKSTGRITAVGYGTATITVTTVDGEITGKCKVKVTKSEPVKKIDIKEDKATLYVGDSKNLSATVSPKDATNKTVKWKSSDEKVATVSTSGKVTAKASGKCIITATAGGKSDTANITVKKKAINTTTPTSKPTPKPTSAPAKTEVISVSMQSSLKMNIGESKTLTVTIIPGNAHDMSLKWSSTDSSVASVEDGTIKGNKAGSATIIATSSNGKKAYCTVLVGE